MTRSQDVHHDWSPPSRYVPRVILKLRRSAGPPLSIEGYVDEALKSRGVPLGLLGGQFPIGPAVRVYREHQDALEKLAARVKARFGAAPEYESYVAIPCVHDSLAFATALAERAPNVIERAFVEAGPAPPPGGLVAYGTQTYLQPAPAGIDAIGMWDIQPDGTFAGATGAGVTLADMEYNWDLTHPELPRGIPYLGNDDTNVNHGTKVLGLLGAQDVASGCRGIAFGANFMVSSMSQPAAVSVAEGIKAALDAGLKAGDVLLVEIQVEEIKNNKYVPAEYDELALQQIQAALTKEIVVVEAAGNDDQDINKYLSGGDSGALIVAAAESKASGWSPLCNYGSRVDCFAPGTEIVTINPDPADWAGTAVISESSAAAAVVAGGAALIQSWAMRNLGAPLSAHDLRSYFKDPTLNTPSIGKHPIGVMPNLTRIRDKIIADRV